MAAANNSLYQQYCSVCLHLLNDPVTLSCGHRVCRICTIRCWDQENQKGVYSCPQCKLQAFPPRHVVNTSGLEEMTKTLFKTTLQGTSPDLCVTHPQPVYKSPALKKHNPFEISRGHQEQICYQHNKLLDVYCRTDLQCICTSCTMDLHKGHDTVSAAAAQAEKQVQLVQMQDKSKQSIQNRENELQKVKRAVESYKQSAQAAIQEGDRIITELIKSIEKRHYELTWLIKSQESAAVSRAEEIIKELEQENAELRRRDTQLQDLLHTHNSVHFLQSFQSVSATPEFAASRTITCNSPIVFDQLLKTLPQIREELETFFTNEFSKISNQDAAFSSAPDSLSSLTFGDLARNYEGFAFKKYDPSFSWANTRTTVFGAKTTASQNEEYRGGSVQEISLSNLTLKSDEVVENALLKQNVKLFKWNHDIGQWTYHGDGDLKILFCPVKKYYQVVMCDRILNMHVNHIITKDIEMKFLNISVHTLSWTALNCAEGNAKMEQLAARFTTPEFAESFRKVFTDCQRLMI